MEWSHFQSNHATTGCIPGWCQASGDGAVDIEPLHCMKKTSRKHMMFLAYRYGVIIAGGEPIIFQPHRRPSSYCSSLSLFLSLYMYIYIYIYTHIYVYINDIHPYIISTMVYLQFQWLAKTPPTKPSRME